MNTMLKGWQGSVKVGDTVYSSISEYLRANNDFSAGVNIFLYPQGNAPKIAVNGVVAPQQQEPAPVEAPTMYRITVKKYMTEMTEPNSSFDFMLKWNNNNPMPLRTMVGWVEKETKGMVKMHLRGQAEATCTCLRCGRTLTNPVSKHYGIGPECMSKLGMVRLDINDIEGITQRLQEVEWVGWIIKSAITEKEEILEDV